MNPSNKKQPQVNLRQPLTMASLSAGAIPANHVYNNIPFMAIDKNNWRFDINRFPQNWNGTWPLQSHNAMMSEPLARASYAQELPNPSREAGATKAIYMPVGGGSGYSVVPPIYGEMNYKIAPNDNNKNNIIGETLQGQTRFTDNKNPIHQITNAYQKYPYENISSGTNYPGANLALKNLWRKNFPLGSQKQTLGITAQSPTTSIKNKI